MSDFPISNSDHLPVGLVFKS